METTAFFSQLLNLETPFSVETVKYKSDNDAPLKKSVHIYLSVDTNPTHRPSRESVIKDYEERTWRHLNLFQYPCYIHCKLPKYKDKVTGKVKTLEASWARAMTGFTLMFEKFVIELIKIHGCVSEVSKQLGVYPQRIWRIIQRLTQEKTLDDLDMSQVKKIGLDETSRKKGHDYITCFIDLDTGELLHIVEGKSAEVISKFEKVATSKGLDKEQVRDISIDMSHAFISGIEKVFPKATITFDKFHVSQMIQKAFDSVRKSVGKQEECKRINKWIFFKDYMELTEDERVQLDHLFNKYPLLERVYQLKNDFKRLWQFTNKIEASEYLSYWTDTAKTLKHSTLTKLAKTLDKHHQRIINVIDSKINTAPLEGFNSKVQTLKRKARGYKHFNNLITIVKLHCAKKPTQMV